MGAPLVRRDELEAEIAKLKAALRLERRRSAKALEEALAPIRAALEIPVGEEDTVPSPVEFPTPLEVAESAGEVPPAPVTGFESIDKDAADQGAAE